MIYERPENNHIWRSNFDAQQMVFIKRADSIVSNNEYFTEIKTERNLIQEKKAALKLDKIAALMHFLVYKKPTKIKIKLKHKSLINMM